MQAIYKILYSTPVNAIVRGICKNMLGSKIQIPPSGIISFTTSQGKEINLKTNPTCFVTKEVYYKGYQAYEYSEYFLSLVKKFNTFLDIGSNIGYFSVLAAKHNPTIKVFAFDPSPGPFHYLKENIILNKIENQVSALDLALSNENGEVVFSIAANPKYSYLKFNSLGGGGHISSVRDTSLTMQKKVRTQTLDSFVEDYGMTDLGLIKMDAENAEHLILQGGIKSIQKFRPVIITEVFSKEMAELIQQEIVQNNYSLYKLNTNTPEKIQSLIADLNDEINNVMMVPAEKESSLL